VRPNVVAVLVVIVSFASVTIRVLSPDSGTRLRFSRWFAKRITRSELFREGWNPCGTILARWGLPVTIPVLIYTSMLVGIFVFVSATESESGPVIIASGLVTTVLSMAGFIAIITGTLRWVYALGREVNTYAGYRRLDEF
jgi:hypothetical protein